MDHKSFSKGNWALQGHQKLAFDWTLAVTAPNRESHISEILSSLEMDHRVFRVVSRLAVNGQFLDILRPVFPGYVFVKPAESREAVLDVVGVVGFVRFGDAMIDVDPIVEYLDEESDGTCILPWGDREEIDEEGFVAGDRVRIKDGVTKGRTAVFARYLSRSRVIVLLDWFGRSVPFTVAEEDLELVEVVKTRHRRRHRVGYRSKIYRQALAA